MAQKKNELNKNNNQRALEEERRRRRILALWLLMFTVLIGLFVYAYFLLFGPERRLKLESKKCLECHGREMRPKLAAKYLHEPFEKERCVQCHPNIVCTRERQAKINKPLDKVCYSCHASTKLELKKKSLHVPFKGARCTNCHDPHSSDYRRLTILPTADLCVSCHYGSAFKQIFKHQPVQMRNCADCHEAHASDVPKQLTLPVGQLCYSCHFRVAQEAFRPVKHAPFGAGQCTRCHKPHSARERKLLASDYNTLCSSCHPDIAADFRRASHHPLGRYPMENCGKCHLYHTGDYRRLLRTGGTLNCYASTCHPGLQPLFEASEHNNTVMGMLIGKDIEVVCSACHSPHGSDYQRLLTIDVFSLCPTCHTFPSTTPEGHQIFVHVNSPPYTDSWHGGYMWCGSCHGFHGTPYPFMKWLPGDALCLKCHPAEELQNPVFQ